MKLKTSNKGYDWVMLVIILMLLIFGLLVMSSASVATSKSQKDSSIGMMKSQIVYAVAGVAVMVAVSFVPHKWYRNLAYWIFWGVLGLNYYTAFFGKDLNGGKRWIQFGSFSFQPSELLKIALVIYLAATLTENYNNWGERSKGPLGILTLWVPVGLSLGALLKQKHISAMVIICAISVVVLFVMGMKKGPLWIPVIAVLAAVIIALAVIIIGGRPSGTGGVASKINNIMDRIEVYRYTFMGNIQEDKVDQGSLDQIQNSLWAIGSGGLTGRGYGKSIQKYSYLSESHNDFVFAVLAEELGYVGVVFAILLFTFLIIRCFQAASNAPDGFSMGLASGIASIIFFQVFFNLGVVSALLPVTGISLPFFSQGGTSLVVILGSMGMMLGIARNSEYEKI